MSINAEATIVVRGGVVQEVYCNYAGVQVTIIDLDDELSHEDELKLDRAREKLDQVY